MQQKSVLLFVASIALLVLVATVYAGGWAIVTVRDLPEYAVAGKRLPLTFMVRGHGMSPIDGLEPKITAKSGTGIVEASAVATKNTGEYTASLVLPRPGNWTIQMVGTIDDPILPELAVIAPGSPTPPPLSQTEVGKRLFVAKGCIGCHANREVKADSQGGVGPDLTARRFPDTYLKSVLADPKAAFAKRGPAPEGSWEMPNLGLTKSEIAALAAFINRERPR
jgi:mono/diheme cytochrome c family protein